MTGKQQDKEKVSIWWELSVTALCSCVSSGGGSSWVRPSDLTVKKIVN